MTPTGASAPRSRRRHGRRHEQLPLPRSLSCHTPGGDEIAGLLADEASLGEDSSSGTFDEICEDIKDVGCLEGPFPFPPPRNPEFSFIDLFAGIDGFRLAFQKAGGDDCRVEAI